MQSGASSQDIYDPEAYAEKGELADLIDLKGIKQLVFPDLHGNAHTFLMRLELYKILEIEPEIRIKLAKIYLNSGSLTRLQQEDQNKVLSPADRDEFRRLLSTAKVIDHEKLRHLLLAGDVVGDRGRSDALTMLVLEKLLDEYINYNNLWANHDWECVSWALLHQTSNIYLMSRDNNPKPKITTLQDVYLYKGSSGIFFYDSSLKAILLPPKAQAYFKAQANAHLFVQPEDNPIKYDNPIIKSVVINELYEMGIIPVMFDKTKSMFRDSLNNLIRFVETYPEEQEWVNNLINKVYLSKLKLFDYSLSVRTSLPTIRQFTHAPAGTEAVRAFANYYLIQYDDSTPEKFFATINQINAKFSEQLVSKATLKVAPGHNGYLLYEICNQLKQFRMDAINGKITDDKNGNSIIDPKKYFFLYLANNRSSVFLEGLSHSNAMFNNTHGHTGHVETPWDQVANALVEGTSLDYENYLGHMTGVYGSSCDRLCSLLNRDEYISMDLNPLALQEAKVEFKAQPLNSSEILRRIKNEIDTETWTPPSVHDGRKIKLANGTQKTVPNKLAKIWNMINNKPGTVSDETLLAQIQEIMNAKIDKQGARIGMWSNTATSADSKLIAFYAKFEKGGEYGPVDTPPIAKIHMPPGSGAP